MERPSKPPSNIGSERRAIIALLTAFALLVQALIPSLASASPMSGPGVMVCTDQGLQAVPGGLVPDQPAPGHACQHCVCPAFATTPQPMRGFLAIAYSVAEAPVAATPHGVRPPTRAPPRPPGQGPPLSDA